MRNKFIKVVNRLVGKLEAENRFQEALAYYERLLAVDNCREQNYQEFMTSYGKLCQMSDVLAVY